MKPQFANVFNVSVNDNRSECSLSFYHMYMQHNYTPPAQGPDRHAGKDGRRGREHHAHARGAHALTRLLIQSFGLPEDQA